MSNPYKHKLFALMQKRKEKRNPVWNLPSRRDNNNGLYLVFTHFTATWSKLL